MVKATNASDAIWWPNLHLMQVVPCCCLILSKSWSQFLGPLCLWQCLHQSVGDQFSKSLLLQYCASDIMSVPLSCFCPSYKLSKLPQLWYYWKLHTCASFRVGSYSLSFLTRYDAGGGCKRCKRGGGQGNNSSRLQALVNSQDSNSWKLRTRWNFSSEPSLDP